MTTDSRTAGAEPGEVWFPIQNVGLIPWSLAERAYAVYSNRHGTSQSLQRIAERGGFGLGELGDLLRNGQGYLTTAQEANLACEFGARAIMQALKERQAADAVRLSVDQPIVPLREKESSSSAQGSFNEHYGKALEQDIIPH